jgi:hypothetical protein
MMMSQLRQAQNAADAAALAAARELLGGHSLAQAQQLALEMVELNGLQPISADAVHVPPAQGVYAGADGYVEVVVEQDVPMFFAQVLPGIGASQTVRARAVAGYEAHSAGEGVAVLDSSVKPGLNVGGQARVRVNGRIQVNSIGGGVDEFGELVANGTASANGGSKNPELGTFANEIRVAGGVDNLEYFKPFTPGEPHPVRGRQLPEPDPLLNLPTPTASTGIDNRFRGAVSVMNNSVSGLDSDTAGQNYQVTSSNQHWPVAGGLYEPNIGDVILHPGIYNSISIQGGVIYMVPGIYVLRPRNNDQTTFKITGGIVYAEGSLFYNTGSNFDPLSGLPDANDGSQPPPASDGASFAGIDMSGGSVRRKPVDTSAIPYATLYDGAQAVSDKYDGMLLFQRRRNSQGLKLAGQGTETLLLGTLYAKWSQFNVTGQATYRAQFLVGSISVTGNGDVTILAAGEGWGKANDVYLVE